MVVAKKEIFPEVQFKLANAETEALAPTSVTRYHVMHECHPCTYLIRSLGRHIVIVYSGKLCEYESRGCPSYNKVRSCQLT